MKFSEIPPVFPTELKIYENDDLLDHINKHSKSECCIKKYLENLQSKKIDLDDVHNQFNYYYKYSLANIKKICLENFNFSIKNEKILLEDILMKILEHNNNKIDELYVNFYYGNIANFISKIISINTITLTENSLKLNNLEYLQPFNKIKKIYVDPSLTQEKSLINRLMNENCNFDKKLNIFSNSEYIDYSMFSNLEKITIKFSSKTAQLFNIALNGTKLQYLYLEDVNEDYKMNFCEKNKFDFNFIKKKNFNSLLRDNNSFQIKKNEYSNEFISRNVLINKSLSVNKILSKYSIFTNKKYNIISEKFGGSKENIKHTKKNEFFRFNVSQEKSKDKFLDIGSKSKSKSPNYDQLDKMELQIEKKIFNKDDKDFNVILNRSNYNYFDVLIQNINIHEKFNSFTNLKMLKFTNCLLNSKFKISHISNLKELYFDDCLFNKVPFDYFASVVKLSFKTCFQKISLDELNFIGEKYKNLNSFSLIDPTHEFLENIIKSNIFFNLKNLELFRIFQENYDDIFKLILKRCSLDRLVFFPDYKRCSNMLLLIKFLDFTLKYNNKLEKLEFLVGLKFHPANIDRTKFFLRKLKNMKSLKLYMPKSEEDIWIEHFKDFKNVDWRIHTEIPDNDILGYYLNQ